MTRKDYRAAAKIVREWKEKCESLARVSSQRIPATEAIQEAFEQFFAADNSSFIAKRFALACIPSKE